MERRLAAILVTDVIGYSRLMGEDEVGTLARLKACRSTVIDPAIEKYHGRIIKLMGDGALIEFASVVDAVECAAAIQRTMATHDLEAGHRRIQLRIGINLGDIIIEGNDLYGDGVNIAARLQAMAEPGGICVSGTAFDHAAHKAGVGFESMGELRLKNIADPIRAYRVVLDPALAGKIVASTKRLSGRTAVSIIVGLFLAAAIAVLTFFQQVPAPPKRPSLAVLPFANLSAGTEDTYFADGITEDLITELAKLSAVDVIARNSAFKYKDQKVDPTDVARDLGVRYIVEGSVRRTGDAIRINAQLVDATTGGLLWADKYDRKAADVFAIQDEVVGSIIAALGVKPTVAEAEILKRLPTTNLEAYDYYLRGEQAARSGFRPQLRRALEFYAKAETLDPNFADAFAADARTSVFIWRNTYDDILPTPVAKKRAYEMASRALSLNPRASEPYAALAVLQAVDGQYEQALGSARRSAALGPNSVDAQIALGFVLSTAGQHEEAEAAIATAQRLDPNLAATDRQVAGLVFFLNGKADDAITTLEQARAVAPRVDDIHILLAAAYAKANRLDDARMSAAEVMRLDPLFNVSYQGLSYTYLRNIEDREAILAAMAKAGLPQWPFDFRGDEKNKLRGEEISRLVFGHTLQGKLYSGSPAIMQIGKDGKMVYRSATLLMTGKAFISGENLCQQGESLVTLRRADCGPVYRRNAGENEPAYVYVNAAKVFYFSPVD